MPNEQIQLTTLGNAHTVEFPWKFTDKVTAKLSEGISRNLYLWCMDNTGRIYNVHLKNPKMEMVESGTQVTLNVQDILESVQSNRATFKQVFGTKIKVLNGAHYRSFFIDEESHDPFPNVMISTKK